MSANENQFSLTRAASINRSASKSKFLAVFPHLLFCGLLLTQSTRADPLNTWTWQFNGLPNDNSQLSGITYGNGLFVAVGENYVATSANGTNWTFAQTINTHTNLGPFGTNVITGTTLGSITFGNRRFVGIGREYPFGLNGISQFVMQTSPDGTNWYAHELPETSAVPQTWPDQLPVAFGNNLFVAIVNATAYVSPDGTNWTGHPLNVVDLSGAALIIVSLTFGNGLFVGTASQSWEDYEDSTGSVIISSSDGVNWTLHSAPTWGNCIGYGDGSFVICGDYGDSAIFSSSNLVNWTASAASSDYPVHDAFLPASIAYGNGTFLAGGYETIISADSGSIPLSWTLRYWDDSSGINPLALTYGNGLWVAVGSRGEGPPVIMTSGSLVTLWPGYFGLHLTFRGLSAAQLNSLIHRYVAVGDLGSILGSTNGVDWYSLASPTTNRLNGVTSKDDGSSIAVGDSGTILTSPDGITWVPLTPVVTNTLYGVAASDSLDVAVGAEGIVLTSTNGENWAQGALVGTNDLLSVAFGNGQFEALSSDGSVLMSSDGVDWTTSLPVLPGQASRLISLSFGDSQFTGLDGNGDVLTSTDGLHWNLLLSGNGSSNALNDASFLNGQLVMVGGGGTILSAQFAVNGTGTTEDLYAVTYGNGMYVGVGDSGTIIKSLDGSAWTGPTNYPGSASELTGVAYGAGRFVGVGQSAWIVTSTDGDNWTSSSTAATDADLSGVAYGAGRFVAIGGAGVIITSTDGLAWTVADSGITDNLDAITWANGRFVITGDGGQTSLTSTNGVNWTVGGKGLGDEPYGVAGGNGLFVAVDQSGEIYSSTDGLTWVAQASTQVGFFCVAYGGGLFVAGGANGTLFVSPSGTNWTQLQSATDQWLYGMCAGNGQFVAVGADGTSLTAGIGALASVQPAMPWLAVSSPTVDDLYSVVFNGQLYVVVAEFADSSLVSTNSVDWAAAGSGLSDYSRGVAWGNGVFVAIDIAGDIFTSVDGRNWTQQASTQADTRAVTFGGGMFVAVADSGEVFTSSNGISWSPHNTGLIGNLRAIVYANGQFVVVADDGTIASSTNGANWTLHNSPTTASLYGITYGNKQYVAVGSSGAIITSPDSLNWSLQTNSVLTPSTLSAVAWGNNEFVAVGEGGWTMRSGDGTNWISSSSATVNDLYCIIFANGSFLAVGENGAIIETPVPVRSQLGPIVQLPDGTLQVTLRGTAGNSYSIEVSSDLVNWSPLTSVTLSSGQGQFADSTSRLVAPRRFYRAVPLP
jgi:hypothetical protein